MSARLRPRRARTDWFRVLADLRSHGYGIEAISRLIDVPQRTIGSWKAGCDATHDAGHRLLLLWSEKTGQGLDQRPMVVE